MRRALPGRGQKDKDGASFASLRSLSLVVLLWIACMLVWLMSQRNSGSPPLRLTVSSSNDQPAVHALKAAALPTPFGCKPREALVQAGFFRALWEGEGFTTHTRCPVQNYMLDVATVLQHTWGDKDIVMFDIGCNKGYDSAMAFELWRPSVGMSRKALGQYITTTRAASNPDTVKGVCSDSDSSFGEAYDSYTPPAEGPTGGLQVHCFEPSQLNYDLLKQVQGHFFGGLTHSGQQRFQVERYAFSNVTGTTHFSKNCNTESCHIQAGGGAHTDEVNVTTVDAMVKQLQLQELFLLKIDTEGFDALVLNGARETLAAHKVSILQFEYHSLGVWRQHSLKSITEWLDGLGYVCYFDGTLLTQLTGCWDPLLEFRAWSNVVCGIKGSAVHRVLATYSLVPFEARYRKLVIS